VRPMKKRKNPRKTGKKRSRGHQIRSLLLASALSLVLALLTADPSLHASQELIYKAARDRMDLSRPEEARAYRYDRENKTDPFASFLVKRREKLQALEEERSRSRAAMDRLNDLKEAKTELQTLELSQLILTAIIKGRDESWAMVRDSKGQGYVLKKGVLIGTNGGKVEKIVRETKKTPYGNEYVRKVLIKEPYLDKKGNISYNTVEMEMASQYYD